MFVVHFQNYASVSRKVFSVRIRTISVKKNKLLLANAVPYKKPDRKLDLLI